MLCRSFPNLRAVVADLPGTLKITRRILREFDVSGRVSTLAADVVRDPIKGGPYDVALLSNILHGEDEATDAGLLRRVHDAVNPGGLLVVKEHCMSPDRTEPEHSAVFALALLLGTRGRTYSFKEMAGWIEAAGFRDLVEVPPEPPMTASLLLAVRPGGRVLVTLPRPAAWLAQPIAHREAASHPEWRPRTSIEPSGATDEPYTGGPWHRSTRSRARTSGTTGGNSREKRERPRATSSGSRSSRGVKKKRPAAKPKPAAGRKARPKARSKRR